MKALDAAPAGADIYKSKSAEALSFCRNLQANKDYPRNGELHHKIELLESMLRQLGIDYPYV